MGKPQIDAYVTNSDKVPFCPHLLITHHSVHLKTLALFLLFVLLAFANIFQTYLDPVCAYIDEAATIVLALWAVGSRFNKHKTRRLNQYDKAYFFLMIVFCLIGLAANFLYEQQPSLLAIVTDFFTCLKFAIAFLSVKCIDFSNRQRDELKRLCFFMVKISLVVLFVLGLACQFYPDSIMVAEMRHGVAAFQFFFGHPSNFAATIVGFIVILSIDPKRNAIYIGMGVLLLFLTMRFKAIGFALLFAGALLFRVNERQNIGIFSIVLISVVLAVSYQQFAVYFLNPITARSMLVSGSLILALKYLPFGSGFATFGSFVTIMFYPELYDELGFGNIYGLTRDNPNYIADSFWPTVLGQFGWIGLIVFVFVVVCLLRSINVVRKTQKISFVTAFAIPIYILIASSAEPAFFSSYAVFLAVCLGMILVLLNASEPKSTLKLVKTRTLDS